MAHAFGQELNISPWDGLLKAVRIAAGKSAYCEFVLSQATNDLELEGRFIREGADENGRGGILLHPDTLEPLGVGNFRDLSWWIEQSALWHDRLAKTSKMAVDAGIAAWQVAQIEESAQKIARVLNAVIDGLEGEIDDGIAARMRALMRSELLAIDAEEQRGIGTVNADPDRAVVDSTGRWNDE